MAVKKKNTKNVSKMKKSNNSTSKINIKVTTNKKQNKKNIDTQIKLNPKFDLKNLMLIILAIIIAAIFVVFIFLNFNKIILFFKNIISVLNSIIIGLVMTYLMSPLYNIIIIKLKHYKYNKVIATICCVLFVIFIVFGLIALLLPQLIFSISDFMKNVKMPSNNDFDILNSIKNNEFISKMPYSNEMIAYLKDIISQIMKTFTDDILPKVSTQALRISFGAMKTLKQILNFLIGIVVMVYVLNMKELVLLQFKKFFFAIFKKETTEKILEELSYAHNVFTGFLFGKIIDSLIIALICYLGCLILKMPYKMLISVIVGVTNIIPFFGPFIGAIPCFVFIVLVSPFKGFIFLIFILVLQQFDGNVLGPYILGDIIGINSFYILFSILLFGGLFGFVGMIIGVPLWCVLSRIFWEIIDSKLIKKQLSTNELDYKSD